MGSVDTPATKKIRINEITSSLSSSRPAATKRPQAVKRAHSETSDDSPLQTAKLPRIESTPTPSSPLNNSGKENELQSSVQSESVDIFSTCIPHHYHTLQDHEKDDQKALTRVKRLLSAISAVKSKSTQLPQQQQQPQRQQQIAPSQRSQNLIPPLSSIPISSASLSSSTTTTTVTTTPISSICPPPLSSFNGPSLDKSVSSSTAPIVSLANVASTTSATTPADSSTVKPFTFGAPTENKPTFNFTATIPPSLVSSSTNQPAIPQFNPSTPASTLNALSTLAGNMVNPTGQFFSVGSAPSTTRKTASRSSKRRNR